MEELSASRLGGRFSGGGVRASKKAAAAAKSDYDEFGGPPQYAVPVASRLDDYSEIFGGLAGSCCIPVLDLPSAMDGLDDVPVDAWRSGFDYAEIFGRFDGGELAVPYQELFAEPKKEEVSCSNESREQRGTGSGPQLTEETEFLPKHLNGDNMACVEEDQSNSNELGDGLKEFNMSYNKTSRGNIEHAISGRTHVAQLNAVPGCATAVDGCDPLQNMSNNPPDMVNRVIAGLDQGKKVPPTSSGDSTMSAGSDLKADQRLHATKFSAAQSDHAKVEHYSRSSGSHSTCTVDVSTADTMYLTLSDISLRTQPLQVPPPSRPPPKLFNKQGLSTVKTYTNSKTDLDEVKLQKPIANHQTHYSVTSSKSHAHQESVKKSSAFFDVEVDASSAAAASTAAMKEAVEIAQSRLKNAKESKERKRDNLQSHKKVGHYEDVKCKERKVDNAAQEVESFNQVQTQKTLLKEEKRINSIASEERHEVTSAMKIALDYEEKVRQVVSAEEDQQSMQATNFKFSEVPDNLEMSSGKWKTDKEFCELIIGEKNDKTVREASEQNIIVKHAGETTMINENKENVNKGAGWACEARRIGKLGEDNGSNERLENTMKLKEGNISCREEEIKEVPDMIPEALVHEEKINMLEVNQDPGKEEYENPGEVPEANVNEEEVKQQYTNDKAPASGECEKTSEPLNDACKFEGAGNEERNLESTKETFEGEDNEKKLSSTTVTCLPSKQEDNLNVDRKTGVLDEIEKEIKVPHGSCMREGGDKVKAVEVVSLCEDSEKARFKVECCYAKNEHRSEDTWVPDEQEESEKINLIREECLSGKNELSLKVASEADKLEGNLKEQKRAIGAMVHGEQEKKTGSAKEACWQNSNEMKTLDAELEFMQNDNQKEGYKAPLQLANEQTVSESDLGMRRSEGINIHMASEIMEEVKKLNGSQGVFQRALDSVMEDVQQTSLLAKEGKIPSSAQDAMKSSGLTSDRTTEDVWQASSLTKKDKLASSAQDAIERCALASSKTANNLHRTEERENERRVEREIDLVKKQERKLEEEKEREKEREKDRLDVERAAREVHERAFAEARERAERMAMERVTAEARQRALAEAREKAEKASIEAQQKSPSGKALREARLRAERAAVERATAEARERAIERALAEKAASEAKERMVRFNATSRERMRKDNVTEDHFKTRDKDMQDVARSALFQSSSSSGTCQRYSDFNSQGEGEPNLRYKARLERHQRTVERAAKALAEKNMRDLLAQRELAERNRLSEYLDAEIKRWLIGKEGNLRALLSTLQYILGPESGWQPISLTDVITAPAVKKAYRKATLCVHPDKLQQRGASIQQKYICEKVFYLLKDAWHRFNSEER